MRIVRFSSGFWVAAAIFCFTLVLLAQSKVHQVTDSKYSMLLSQSLIEHRSFKLDNYAIPRQELVNHGYYTSIGMIYQLEVSNNHIYYLLPPGSSVLSVPFVALMKLFGTKATNADGTYSYSGEVKLQSKLAALLMAILAVIFFYTARLRLSHTWSAIIALGATFGTQSWSTASRGMWTDTWGVVLLGLVVLMLLAHETGKRPFNPIFLASLLAWAYFVRPTYAVHIIAITVYLAVYHRDRFIPYATTGFAWFAGFVIYSWYHYRQFQPSYYHAKRLNSSVFWTALAGNLLSPARGLLVYVPALIFVGYLLVRFWKYVEFQRLVVLSLGIIVGHLIAVSAFSHWWGGHAFGPRFTTGLLPWLVLLTILGIKALLTWRGKRHETGQPARWRAQLIAGGALLVLSIFINGRGAMSHSTWLWNTRPISVDERPERLWDWREPQFLAGWMLPSPPRRAMMPLGRIDFSTADADNFLWYGWADREDRFRWTDGKEAALAFSLDPMTDTQLILKIGSFLAKGKIAEQRVYVTLNGERIETLVLKEEKAVEYKLLLPTNLLRDQNILVFGLPDAASPVALGVNEDTRQLGIAMYWIHLHPQPALEIR